MDITCQEVVNPIKRTRARGWKKRTREQVIARNDRGQKQCRSCWGWFNESEYLTDRSRTSDGLSSRCNPCNRFRRYGLTRVDVEVMLAEQGYRCAVCPREFISLNDFHVDHNNKCCPGTMTIAPCGKCTRGLVCPHCNIKILPVVENAALVAMAREYLAKYA